jgi:hypothetical protein
MLIKNFSSGSGISIRDFNLVSKGIYVGFSDSLLLGGHFEFIKK